MTTLDIDDNIGNIQGKHGFVIGNDFVHVGIHVGSHVGRHVSSHVSTQENLAKKNDDQLGKLF